MLQIDGRNTLKKKRGTTKDIINEVLNTYQDTWHTTAELAETLRRGTEEETCRAVFDFIIANVNYNEDPNGVQWIRTPARLLHDREGDCKSMAILSASLLNNLGIPCFLRFVSFSRNNQITHVYTVTESGIIIDPVERIDGQPVFNYASDYTYKKDMNTTQISRLSGIGATEATEDIYTPYMADTYFWDNTIAENYLFSELDVINAYLTYINSEDREYLNQLDRVVVAYNLYQRSKGYSELMERAGRVLQAMEDNNLFTLATIDEESRTANLGQLVETAIDMLLGGEELNVSGVYLDWWNTQIKTKDYNGLSQANIDNYKSKIGIGLKKEEAKNALLADMQKSAPYFLYLYLGEEWVRKNKAQYPAIYKKYKIEKALFDSWVENAKKVFDKDTIYNNLRSGFLKKTKQTPEQFIQQTIESHKKAKIGLDPAIWAAIITGIATIIIAVIGGIIELCGKSMQSPDNYPSGTPDYYDFDVDSYSGSNTTGNSNIVKYGAIALIVYTLFKKNK